MNCISIDEHFRKDAASGQVLIRQLRWEDFEELIENYYSFHDELQDNPDIGLILDEQKPSMQDEASWFCALYSDVLSKKAIAYVAEIGGRPVGVCDIRSGTRRPVSHVGTLGIAILKEYRRLGIGEKLMTRSLAAARGLFDVIVLDVFSVNEGAKQLYAKLGFKSMGVLPMAVKRNGRYYDEERMYLVLGTADGTDR